MSFSKTTPFDDLPLLPPNKKVFETIPIYKKLKEARAVLAELKGRMPIIPNPDMLINTLVLQEARDSSLIENIQTTNDILHKGFSSTRMKLDNPTKEVLRYREALWQAFNKLKPSGKFTNDVIISIFQKITLEEEGYRSEQVRIGNQYHTVYTPVSPDKIKAKMKNWLQFANQNEEIDPLLRMAMLHYQFESIHPFVDGNGRTGRILNVLYLNHSGLLDLPILYLSKYILEFKDVYYRLFTEVTQKQNWEDWLLFMLDGVLQTASYTLAKTNAIYQLFSNTLVQVSEQAADIYSHELIEAIFSQTDCKISFLEEKGIASRNTASKYLNKLCDLKILERSQVAKESLYRNVELYKLLSN